MLPVGSVAAADSGLSSEQVAGEILRVQDKADQVAQAWADAQRRLDDLAGQLAAAEARLAETAAQYSQIETDLTQIAVNRFTGASHNTMLVVFGNPAEELHKNVLLDIALDQGAGDLDLVDSVRSDLDRDRERVAGLRAEGDQIAQQLTSRQTEIEQQLSELATLREHLKDEEVKRAYEDQVAKRRRDLAAQQAQAAPAPQPTPVAQFRGGGTEPSVPSSAAPTTPAATPAAQPPTPAIEPDPIPDPEPTPEPVATPAPVLSGNGWFCPVAGPTAFGDTWGAPRPGGRKHEGVDMMSPLGTPLVAVVAGTITMKTSTLGGNLVSLAGVDGNRYFYGHLSAWEGGPRSVSAGEVIGYVGSTGQTAANHLHFQIHPGGGAPVNPYPTVRQAC